MILAETAFLAQRLFYNHYIISFPPKFLLMIKSLNSLLSLEPLTSSA